MSTLFSKICQLLNVLFSKISPQNLDFFIDRRRFIDADTVCILKGGKKKARILMTKFNVSRDLMAFNFGHGTFNRF